MCTSRASDQSEEFPHPACFPLSFVVPSPPPLDTPGKGRKKKKKVHEKQLLGFAFSRTPAETVSVCVWGVDSPATLATRYSSSVGPEQKATGGRGRGTQGLERAQRPAGTALLREELPLAFNRP